jgi:hypothetical protein
VQVRYRIKATLTPAQLEAFRQFKDKCCDFGFLDHANTASRDNHVGIIDDVTLFYGFLRGLHKNVLTSS